MALFPTPAPLLLLLWKPWATYLVVVLIRVLSGGCTLVVALANTWLCIRAQTLCSGTETPGEPLGPCVVLGGGTHHWTHGLMLYINKAAISRPLEKWLLSWSKSVSILPATLLKQRTVGKLWEFLVITGARGGINGRAWDAGPRKGRDSTRGPPPPRKTQCHISTWRNHVGKRILRHTSSKSVLKRKEESISTPFTANNTQRSLAFCFFNKTSSLSIIMLQDHNFCSYGNTTTIFGQFSFSFIIHDYMILCNRGLHAFM